MDTAASTSLVEFVLFLCFLYCLAEIRASLHSRTRNVQPSCVDKYGNAIYDWVQVKKTKGHPWTMKGD